MTIRQEISKFSDRRPAIFLSMPFVITGMIDLIRAWRKHDLADAIAVSVIFFVVAPLWATRWRKQDWNR